ncbi:MAG TPA: peptidase E [Polyangia bacterium]|nr:peptidase E [Polyangia bacterium]
MAKQIVAMGGGGFMMEPENPRLDDYILSLARGRESRVCYVPTATGDNPHLIANFYRLLGHRCRATHLSSFMTDVVPAVERLDVDIIYVSGGNTANMLAIWRLHGIDQLMRAAYDRGVILCGLSAGALCWFGQGVTDSFGPPRGMECLGFIPDSFCPHYVNDATRRPSYHRFMREGMPAGYAATDSAAIHFVDGKPLRAVASHADGRAFFVQQVGDDIEEKPIPIDLL